MFFSIYCWGLLVVTLFVVYTIRKELKVDTIKRKVDLHLIIGVAGFCLVWPIVVLIVIILYAGGWHKVDVKE